MYFVAGYNRDAETGFNLFQIVRQTPTPAAPLEISAEKECAWTHQRELKRIRDNHSHRGFWLEVKKQMDSVMTYINHKHDWITEA